MPPVWAEISGKATDKFAQLVAYTAKDHRIVEMDAQAKPGERCLHVGFGSNAEIDSFLDAARAAGFKLTDVTP